MRYFIFILIIIFQIGCQNKVSEYDMYIENNEYSKAIEYINKIIEKETTNGKVFYDRGYCYNMIEDYSKSNSDFKACVKLNYRKEDSYYNIACNHAIVGEDSIALHYFKKVLELNPKNKEVASKIKLLEMEVNIIDLF